MTIIYYLKRWLLIIFLKNKKTLPVLVSLAHHLSGRREFYVSLNIFRLALNREPPNLNLPSS
jgi:hypothetical protein